MKLDNGLLLKDSQLWTHGGIDIEQNRFTSDDRTSWRLISPISLPSMTKIIFTVPTGVMVRAVLCKKTNVNTGDINLDYQFDISSTKWRIRNHEIYAGSEDTYVMFVVKYEDDHTFDYSEMPVVFYSPQKNEIPAYWVNNLHSAIDRIEKNRQKIENPVELFYLTDVHWIENAQRSPAILNYLSEKLNIKHTVFGGDMIVRYNHCKEDAKREINGFFDWLSEDLKIFVTLGNHDRNYSSGNSDRSLRFSEPEVYELFRMKQAESFAVMENDPCHGYFDFPAQKTRIVQFYLSDSMFGMPEDSYVDGALDWVEQKILELEQGWTVLLFTHAYWRGSKDQGYILTDKNREISNRVLEIKERAKANLAFWITGHIHNDCMETLSNKNTSIPIISVLSDGYKYSNSPTAAKMFVGTDTEQCIDCIQIDLKSRNIHCTRIGAGKDRVYHF